ncbi:MAG: hypothetical protein A2667_02415 [Candidatus Wildermuthbacteria bacterium RIFCSPHIGHO2_01_FULL_47_27]|uniref:Uncharacterized protein n=2 Tax=Candidatus Wildermuthiibacteriota TaxID=1817923 RepID=A0A1G2RNS2_9BACT|nr:MAG: Mannose-P-dolichol utilization defect 1 protein [Parcubacteria group bacterium GW2011_GWA2_47_9]OHA63582.1 MAG: hypothetical protein A2667_02415 [Candidatus Wildermuthbacteria bacterium RIFCSPHIGHO2_01_FULL_47_27]OHA67229.1 MAG: hypothetical protein A3D59_00280 [Candidatus Wildermuthbacteria bacterium RIFCSPHIGHO2_02_FULL_47_17]OHA74118.1 MAG: hypothetical protein A3A32_00285 [Candidatus Wildermuthbacteria bacterium RIFCSPLOWO2_01_FULL_48_35]OHA76626.1 MAG: hypothetical protein A3I38_00
MNLIFEALSWAAMLALIITSVPQITLNFKRKSTEGVSWLTYGLLLFGMTVLFLRSLFTTDDFILKLNYGAGAFVILIVNLQFIFYRNKKRD